MGRPTVMTEQVKEEICQRIASNETVRQICASDHMPGVTTVMNALLKDASFQAQYARARELQLARWEDEIIEVADDATNDWMEREGKNGDTVTVVDHDNIQRSKLRIDTRKWIMSKRLPKKYGDRLQHSGDEDQPITHRIECVIVRPENPDS